MFTHTSSSRLVVAAWLILCSACGDLPRGAVQLGVADGRGPAAPQSPGSSTTTSAAPTTQPPGAGGTNPNATTTAPPVTTQSFDAGHTDTAWATSCPTGSQYACVSGTWSIQNPTTANMPPVRYETAHFALRWNNNDVTQAQAESGGKALEAVWTNHTQTVGFIEPYCKQTTKYKVNIHLDPSFGLSGSGTGEMDPAMWIGPGGLSDPGALAHEFAHALQFASEGFRDSPMVGWFWEDHAEFMSHSIPERRASDVGCTELSVDFPHVYLGSTRDRYCTWQFLDFLKDKYCYQAVNNLWTTAMKPRDPNYLQEDPFSVIARSQGWTAAQLNDFFGEWMLHNVSWDYRNPDGSDSGPLYRGAYGDMSDTSDVAGREGWRKRRVTTLDVLDANQNIYATPPTWAPQRWGYNLVRLYPTANSNTLTVRFRGVLQQAPANTQFGAYNNQPANISAPNSDWRWGVVAVNNNRSRYSAVQRGSATDLTFTVNAGDSVWLAVMATPTTIAQVIWDQMDYSLYRYPWMAQFENAVPEGYQPQQRSGGRVWPNGGGWVANAAQVASTVFVGPQAQVLGGKVSDQARILDHAMVVNANVSGNAVIKGISVLAGGLTVSGKAIIDTTFQPPGSYEPQQSVGGSAMLLGDVELREQSLSVTQGNFYGFIDSTVIKDPKQGSTRTAPVPEVTAPGPYVWRP